MSIEVIMPQMGESIVEGTLTRWLKKVGESVQRDEPLFEISTDKVDTEIPSPADGVIQEVRVKEGETVPVETVVALLTPLGQEAAPSEEPLDKETPGATAPREEAAPVELVTEVPATPQPVLSPASSPEAFVSREERVRQRSSPLVKRIAREHGIDVGQIKGTGSGGRVTKQDILAIVEQTKEPGTSVLERPAAEAVKESAAPREKISAGDDVRIESMSVMRQKIAEHMVLSKRTSPHVTTVFEVDMTEVANQIATHREAFQRINGVKLTYLPFIMKAIISGLKEYPSLNATIQGDEIHYFKRIHLGMAVALEDGLIVPVVKDADEKSIVGLARTVKDLADRARSKKLEVEEVHGGTFTITNYGIFGGLFATPVINQPQAGIVGVGSVHKRPVVLPGTDAIAVRSMVYLALSFDHRLVDGATGEQFLAHVKEILQRCPYSPMGS